MGVWNGIGQGTLGVFVSILALGCEVDPLASGASGPADCDACHGTEENIDVGFAIDWEGSLGEGAHRIHLEGTVYGKPIPCEECHAIPDMVDEDGHVDPLPTEIVFGELARAGGANPTWNRETGRCTNVYCHGATVCENAECDPIWTLTDGTQTACGSCHNIPPGGDHPDVSDCGMCHGTVYADGGWVDPDLHIDGNVQTGSD